MAAPEFRGKIYDSILDTIGATPLVRLDRLAAESGVKAQIIGKLEFFNPLASVKDRIGRAMIEAAEAAGTTPPAAPRWSSPPPATPASRWPSWPPPRATS
ncbi:pyridoxal-phosphate dependent enzyme [Azospirillum sp. A29]|uniref:pyridoxal-phosphate dependent enzyme n=1 Tax=Azospirillum sp. A29 TaxID=3160606 RepID=UPI00366A7BD5